MVPYIPHTDSDRNRMLQAIGVDSIDQLFDTIPPKLRYKGLLPINEGLSEHEVIRLLQEMLKKNILGTSYLGMGSYDRIIPPTVSQLASHPTFVSAYTPYQPEISQGLLQAMFEYQSMISELTGLEISNASLYDGHTACSEAGAIMISSKRKSTTLLVSETLHPFSLSVLNTWALGTEVTLVIIPETERHTSVNTMIDSLSEEVAGVIVQSPNRYGVVENYTSLSEAVHQNKSLLTISSDPLSLLLQKTPSQWGADIAVGDTQPLGLPSAFGGPSCGYIAVSKRLMRSIPGRVVGLSTDIEGNRAYTLTLQAREQHIRRERATSNICSNQALAAITTAIHIALVGPEGLTDAATQSYDKAHYLHEQLSHITSLRVDTKSPFWCEFPLFFESKAQLDHAVSFLQHKGIYAGVRLGSLTTKKEDEATLIVAVTEKRSKEELDIYVRYMREALA